MKHAVITGAADGIGKALAAAFLRAGYRVTGIDIDADKARITGDELGTDLVFILADLTRQDDINRVVNTLDSIDVLIHNAGINEVGAFPQTNLTRQHAVIDLNVTAPLVMTAGLLTKAALNDAASIVVISSLSRYVSYPGASVYAATKDGVVSYARTLATALPDYHVLTVYPGPTRTAHARRYSPDNSREASRMSPDVLAEKIIQAVHRRQRVLIPSAGLSLFALLGIVFPSVTRWLMRKMLYEKLSS